ncbi:transposase [Endozoicomonas sp. SCSIO W0465]|uniref:transposase n=1 Tax=Endozoicomonas sp. SCSIO W0465 TaxID=2918516 RepID=UPI0020762425|nr:transposase [Endozoicomonas sp. SCSIO W0465]USE35280.1 transposase [Endozoicomonas sp. SCSIO W0465]
MARYSEELKESIIQMMMPPNNVPVSQLVRDIGISDVTLYTWRKKALSQGIPVPSDGKNPDQWTPENQLAVIIEKVALNETEMVEYCRKKGLFAEQLFAKQIEQWKPVFILKVDIKLHPLHRSLILYALNNHPVQGVLVSHYFPRSPVAF